MLSIGCSEPAAPHWPEIAQLVGLECTHANGAEGSFQLPEIMGAGCALFDFDCDGDLDVYTVNSGFDPVAARNRLFENQLSQSGQLNFGECERAAGADDNGFGMGVAAGDYDADGWPDLYLTNFGQDRLLRNNSGRFTDQTAAAQIGDTGWGSSAAFADLNGDGMLDIYVANYMQHPRHSQKSCRNQDGAIEYCGPLTHFDAQADILLLSLGDGSFEDRSERAGLTSVAPAFGLGVCVRDFNQDGQPDVFVANDAVANHLWINDGSAHFEERAREARLALNMGGAAEASMGIVAEDLNGDEQLDLFLTHLVDETHTLYQGDGQGQFRDETEASGLHAPSFDRTGFGVAALDAEHDGDLDLIVANGRIARGALSPNHPRKKPWNLYAECDQFFLNTAIPNSAVDSKVPFVDFSARAGPSFLVPHVGRGLAKGDVDRDGDVDILITSNGGDLRLLRNDAPKLGSSLVVEVKSQRGGYAALGARVQVRHELGTQTRVLASGDSYLSSHAPQLHFGLGAASVVDIFVEWPDGSTRLFESVPTGTHFVAEL